MRGALSGVRLPQGSGPSPRGRWAVSRPSVARPRRGGDRTNERSRSAAVRAGDDPMWGTPAAGTLGEADWKRFRRVQPAALDRFCERVLVDVGRLVAEAGR